MTEKTITTQTLLPDDYDERTAVKMRRAGLLRIETDFDGRHFIAPTRYIFKDRVVTDATVYRRRVFSAQDWQPGDPSTSEGEE